MKKSSSTTVTFPERQNPIWTEQTMEEEEEETAAAHISSPRRRRCHRPTVCANNTGWMDKKKKKKIIPHFYDFTNRNANTVQNKCFCVFFPQHLFHIPPPSLPSCAYLYCVHFPSPLSVLGDVLYLLSLAFDACGHIHPPTHPKSSCSKISSCRYRKPEGFSIIQIHKMLPTYAFKNAPFHQRELYALNIFFGHACVVPVELIRGK